MKHKSDVFGIFKKWKAQVKNQIGRKIKYLRTDNGLEYRDKEFIGFCEQNLSRKSQMHEIECRVA